MGQYYIAVVVDAKDANEIRTLSPHEYDNGAKLMEHSWVGNDFVNAVYTLIHNNPACIAWVGDYSNDTYDGKEDAYAAILPYKQFMQYYKAAWGSRRKSSVPRKSFSDADLNILNEKTTGMYLINHDRCEYIDLEAYIAESIEINKKCDGGFPGHVNPLPLLCACGNDRGGGDFRGSCLGYEKVGIWAFARLEYSEKVPNGYRPYQVMFSENMRAAVEEAS